MVYFLVERGMSMSDIEIGVALPLFETLPKKVAVIRQDALPTDPTYGGIAEFLKIDVSAENPEDMGGRGTMRQHVFEGDGGSQYGRYDITFTAPFSNHFHRKSWEIISVQEGEATIKLGGVVSEQEKGAILDGGFAQEIQIKPGDVVVIPPNTPQGIDLITGSLTTRVLMSPPFDRAKDSFKFAIANKPATLA